MSIEVSTNINTKELIDGILKRKKDLLAVALQDATVELLNRTKSGRDASGSRFKPLSPQYLKYKVRKTGRGAPDLYLTGAMQKAITSKVDVENNLLIGKIYFTSTKEAEKARGNEKTRKFFELAKAQITTILNKLRSS